MVRQPFSAVPPDLHDGAGVILCNPEHATLLSQMCAGVDPQSWHDGQSGETAAESAERFARQGVHDLRILTGPRDQRGAEILQAACQQAGLSAEIHHTSSDGTSDLFPAVEIPVSTAPVVLRFPVEEERHAEFLDQCRELCRTHGPENLRLAPPLLMQTPPRPERRSPLPQGLGLHDAEWRTALVSLVTECWPRSLLPFLATVGIHDLGANPLENCYAGLGLRERNADLLVNIVDVT
ncbi:MAG: hypothetical protein VX951_12720 [Planctomycetota bacterium]|nr:hypothetical protein [Planctomycetota bacterium]